MRIRGLSDEQIESYFSDTISKDEMLTYLEGSEQQGYRRGGQRGKRQMAGRRQNRRKGRGGKSYAS